MTPNGAEAWAPANVCELWLTAPAASAICPARTKVLPPGCTKAWPNDVLVVSPALRGGGCGCGDSCCGGCCCGGGGAACAGVNAARDVVVIGVPLKK